MDRPVRPAHPERRSVLEVACGAGRYARLFLERGHPVTALDVETGPIGALGRHPGLEVVRADLDGAGRWPFPGREFAGIVVTNYLWRPLFPHLIDALAPGGVLLNQTFAVDHAAYGRPARPEFLLGAGELLDLVRGRLRVVAYEHGYVAEPRPSVRQRICAAKAAERLPLTPHPQAGGAGAGRPLRRRMQAAKWWPCSVCSGSSAAPRSCAASTRRCAAWACTPERCRRRSSSPP